MGARVYRRWRRSRIAAWPALGLLVVVAAACGSPSSGPPVASLPGSPAASTATGPLTVAQSDHDMVEFARCLRAHGVPEPDPAHIPGHSGLSVQVPAPGPSTNAALAACNHFLAPIAAMKAAGTHSEMAQWLPMLTGYAQCMRAHDISMLDPNAQGAVNLGNVPGIDSGFGRYSPQFRAADAACRHLLPAAIHDDGTGP